MKITIKDIDVFILTHNRAHLLPETLGSVLAQTVVPDKITVLDNESTDNTEEVCRSYKNKNVVYVKTFGQNGNYLKSKQLASRKYMIRLHDDNLINIHFFEKILFMLNTYENVSLASTSYKIFFTGYQEPFPYRNIIDEIKKVYLKRPLKEDVIVANNDREFIIEQIKRTCDRSFPPMGSTPFLIIKTDVFKAFDAEKEYRKYAKADDIALFLFALEYGRYVCLSDTNSAFFRAHPNRDSETDDNSLDLNQVENWTRFFTKPIREENSPEIWKSFFTLFYFVFPNWLKKNLAKTYSNAALLERLFNVGALPSFSSDFYNEEEILNRFRNSLLIEQEMYESYCGKDKQNFLENLSKYERIFSVKNFTKNGIKRKYLILFNHRIRLWKVKKRQK